MSPVLRRIETPTRYGGLPIKGWLAGSAVFIGVVLIITVFKTPLAPTLTAISWLLLSPALVLSMWAHQQGVSVTTLLVDFVRHSTRRQSQLQHVPAPMLRGGIVLSGTLPRLSPRDPGPADHDSVLEVFR
ncbi:MAG: hypothetical protein AAGC46_15350 [Solirubrobacteraceae bacterium]|nr:hypothetical protein [Patulibacter sp.]